MRSVGSLLCGCLLVANVWAVDKPPRRSLQELTDPGSPSYVLHPYPKSPDGFFENYVNLMTRQHALIKSGRVLTHTLSTPWTERRQWKWQEAVVSPRSSTKVGRVFRVHDEKANSRYQFEYLLELRDSRSSALNGYVLFGDDGSPMLDFPPPPPNLAIHFKSEDEVSNLFAAKFGPGKRVDSVEIVAVDGEMFNLLPIYRIRAAGDVFYFSNFLMGENWYKVESRVALPAGASTVSCGVDPGEITARDLKSKPLGTFTIQPGQKMVPNSLDGYVHLLRQLD